MKKHRTELEVYSGIAILFVVILHSNAYYLSCILKLGSYMQGGFLLNLVDKIVHAAVPMFIFIAGYKYRMNNQKETYREYFMKKMRSVFKPFFIISTFYLCYHWVDVFLKRLMYTGVYDIQYVAERFITGFYKMFIGYNFAYQLWYIPMYLMICLSYPFFYRHLKSAKLRFGFFIGLAILWEALVLMRITYVANNPYPFVFIYYFFIYELGCSFYSSKLAQTKSPILMLLYPIMLIIVNVIRQPMLSRLMYELIFVPVAVVFYYQIALLLRDNSILKQTGKYSFYIYLFHEPLVLSVLSRFLLKHGWYQSYFIAMLLAVVSVIVSLAIYKLISISLLKNFIFAKPRSLSN